MVSATGSFLILIFIVIFISASKSRSKSKIKNETRQLLNFEAHVLSLYCAHEQRSRGRNSRGHRGVAGTQGREPVQDPRLRQRRACPREPERTAGENRRRGQTRRYQGR